MDDCETSFRIMSIFPKRYTQWQTSCPIRLDAIYLLASNSPAQAAFALAFTDAVDWRRFPSSLRSHQWEMQWQNRLLRSWLIDSENINADRDGIAGFCSFASFWQTFVFQRHEVSHCIRGTLLRSQRPRSLSVIPLPDLSYSSARDRPLF